MTYSGMFNQVASKLVESSHPPFEFAVVDEAQDLSPMQLRCTLRPELVVPTSSTCCSISEPRPMLQMRAEL